METLVLKVAYDGTHYSGIQRQNNAITVEEVLTKALSNIYKESCTIVPASRTDAGVHARGMVVHVRLNNSRRVPVERIEKALNSQLPPDVRIVGVHLRPDISFHARYDAISRCYTYTLSRCNDPLKRLYCWYIPFCFDEHTLHKAALLFVGTHDFTTYSKLIASRRSHVCSVEVCQWDECDRNTYRLTIRANRFVYGMVRALVGAMVDCARGRCTLDDLIRALDARDRSRASPLAPPHGLVFEYVEYPLHLNVDFYHNCIL